MNGLLFKCVLSDGRECLTRAADKEQAKWAVKSLHGVDVTCVTRVMELSGNNRVRRVRGFHGNYKRVRG